MRRIAFFEICFSRISVGEPLPDGLVQLIGMDEPFVGGGRDRESHGHQEFEAIFDFPQRRILAADRSEQLSPDDVVIYGEVGNRLGRRASLAAQRLQNGFECFVERPLRFAKLLIIRPA